MYRLLTALLCFVSMLAACGSAGGDIRPHESDQREEAAARAQLAAEVRRQVRATSAETGVADLDDGLVAAIAEVPRHAFLPDQLRPFAYLDIPLPLTRDQNVAQPSLMALMTQLARIGKNDVVFETGTDCGYHAAILTRLAKKVYSVEISDSLAAQAKERLARLGYNGIEVQAGDGFYGWAGKAPFDVIIVKEAVQDVPPPHAYYPHWQRVPGDVDVVVRTSAAPDTMARQVRAVLHGEDPTLPIAPVREMQALVEGAVQQRRFQSTLVAVFAVSALLVASLGIYGVVAYSVARRRNEIGIRMALGASQEGVVTMFVRRGLVLALGGIALGTMGAYAVTRVLRSLLFGVSERDPLTFAAVALLLGGVALFASWIPARRAARVDPLVAMRMEG